MELERSGDALGDGLFLPEAGLFYALIRERAEQHFLHDPMVAHTWRSEPQSFRAMARPPVSPLDYDTVASAYDRRYALRDYRGIRDTLMAAVRVDSGSARPTVLEIGCGTGKWLRELASADCDVAGIDPSREMLAKAAGLAGADLRVGVADALPWKEKSFDVVCCVNAFHHFASPDRALAESWRVLRPGGVFLSIGMDPHENRDRWSLYDFFPETLPLDLARFPSRARRIAWLEAANFVNPSVSVAEHLKSSSTFDEALADGIIERTYTSQLTLLTDEQYAAGVSRIRDEAARNADFRLVADIVLYVTEARKPL